MIRIGILGTDNTHADTFAAHFNLKTGKEGAAGGRVVAVFGLDEARTLQVAERGKIPTIVKRPEHMIGLIDAAIVDFRHGSRHLRYARPMIQAGIPTFIDKPFAVSTADARAMVALARKHKVAITSFSTLRFGAGLDAFKKAVQAIGRVKALVMTGPGNARDPHDGFFFYAIHQVELMLEVFGNDVESARGVDNDGTLVASVRYRNGMIATIHETNAIHTPFTAQAFGERAVAPYDSTSCPDSSLVATRTLVRMFKTGAMPLTLDELTVSTRVLVAIQQSIRRGGAAVAIARR